MTSETNPTNPTASTATVSKTRGGGIMQRIQIVTLLLVGMFFGGYYLGTQAQFHLQENPSMVPEVPGMALLNPPVKRWYWLHTKGSARAGYRTRVMVNGQLVGTFFEPDTNVDITKFLKPGKNTISYSAKSLPADQRDSSAAGFLTIEFRSAAKKPAPEPNKFEGGDVLTEYTRHANENQDFTDVNLFESIE